VGTVRDIRLALPPDLVRIWNLGAVGTITLAVRARQSAVIPAWHGTADACLYLPAVPPRSGLVTLQPTLAVLGIEVAGERLGPLWGVDALRDGVPWRSRGESFQSDISWWDAFARAEQWGRREAENVLEALAKHVEMLRSTLAAARESATVPKATKRGRRARSRQ
jgi:hypothetical protein